MNKHIDFCIACRKQTEYELRMNNVRKRIRGKEHEFSVISAICKTCGSEMGFPWLIDLNIKRIDDQYRLQEGLVSVEDIRKLMALYDIGKTPLSLALGFGEVTLPRYLCGQMPSRQCSKIIGKALESPDFMRTCLAKNRQAIGETAFKKSMAALKRVERLFDLSEAMLGCISYIFARLEEVTPLALQKLLYYAQGIFLARYNIPLFEEDCQAWVHGPVYVQVYGMFRDFKFNPIDDERFAVLRGRYASLKREAISVLDTVLGSFGQYGGKLLENITHQEAPWLEARQAAEECERTQNVMEKDAIKRYFLDVKKTFGIDTIIQLEQYIESRKATV